MVTTGDLTVMRIEQIPCPLCAGKEQKVIFKARDFRLRADSAIFNVVKCARCGFLFLSPRPAQGRVSEFYPPDFNKRDTGLAYRLIEPCFRAAQRSTVRLFKKYKENGRALDIGCGNGEFVSVMLSHGYDAFGFEQNPGARKFADKSLGGRIFYNDISQGGFADKTFDIITMFQSLEHIYSPGSLFREISRILKDDGLLYVCVPNADFFEFSLFGPYAYNLDVPRHAYFFTRKTLKQFLVKFGFVPVLFPRDYLSEFVSTPASIYHSVCYFFQDKKMPLNNFIKAIIYFPLIMLKLILRFVFIFQDQNLKVLCRKI